MQMNIVQSSISMKSKPSEKSSLETECLFGETVEVLDEKPDWFYCKLITDNYHGWVKKFRIGKFREATHRVLNIRTFIYKDADLKSNIELYLPMGSRLAIEKINSVWAKIHYIKGKNFQLGYVPSNHIVQIEDRVLDWVASAEQLLDIPYKWGGRDTVGIDCSALLQLSYQTYGKNIPRNTSDQVQLNKLNIRKVENLERGCVIFWEGHVGIMVDRFNCIHANAYHMKTVTEPLIDIINRMDKDNQVVKMMNFN